MPKRRLISIGQVIGKRTILEELPKVGYRRVFRYRCQCGRESIVSSKHIDNGCGCGCAVGYWKKPKGAAAFNWLYRSYTRSAKKRKIEWHLRKDEFEDLAKNSCFYCKTKPNALAVSKSARHNGNYTYNGIDRVDSSKGYQADNVVPCCKMCNYAKNSMTQLEFKKWIVAVYKHLFLK